MAWAPGKDDNIKLVHKWFFTDQIEKRGKECQGKWQSRNCQESVCAPIQQL